MLTIHPLRLFKMVAKSHDVGTRLQALCMLEYRLPIAQIVADTSMSSTSIYRLLTEAKKRGYNSDISKQILLSYVADTPRSGRPITATTPAIVAEVEKLITRNSTTREYLTQQISNKLPAMLRASARSVHRIIHSQGYRSRKPTFKPGLKDKDKLARLTWCLDHKD